MSWSPLDENAKSDGTVIGDEPFNLIASCFGKVARIYKRDWKRKPSLRELIGTVSAVLEAQLQDHTSDGQTAEIVSLSFKTKKIPKRQKYAVGDVLKADAANGRPIYARVFEIHPMMGPMVGVYDSLGISPLDLNKRPRFSKFISASYNGEQARRLHGAFENRALLFSDQSHGDQIVPALKVNQKEKKPAAGVHFAICCFLGRTTRATGR